MPQDAFTLRLTARELDAALTGGRVNRINQPEREELSFIIYTGKRTVKLTLNVNASDCGAYFSEDDRENPLVAPNFCMLLRKHLQSAEILSVEQVGFERILAFRFRCVSDFSTAERVLYAEIMGKYSNLLLTENGVILGALKTTSADEATKRMILAGAKYVLPAPQDKVNPSDRAALRRLCDCVTGDLEHFLFTRVAGLAPCTARMIAEGYRGGDLADHVYGFIFSDETQPCVLERDGGAVDFYARAVQGAKPFETLSAAQTYFYAKRRAQKTLEGARRRLTAAVNTAIKKQEKRLAQISEKQKEAQSCETVRVKGELLTANLYALERGMKSCELQKIPQAKAHVGGARPAGKGDARRTRLSRERSPLPRIGGIARRSDGGGRGTHGHGACESAADAYEKEAPRNPVPRVRKGRIPHLCGAEQRSERPPYPCGRARRRLAARAGAAFLSRRDQNGRKARA